MAKGQINSDGRPSVDYLLPFDSEHDPRVCRSDDQEARSSPHQALQRCLALDVLVVLVVQISKAMTLCLEYPLRKPSRETKDKSRRLMAQIPVQVDEEQ
jgi:hypothetical protein